MASARDHDSEELQKYLLQWKTQRDAIQSEFDADRKRDEYEFQRAKEEIEAEYHREGRALSAGGPESDSISLLGQYLAEKKATKLNALQRDYDDRQEKRQAYFDKRMLDYNESFAVQLTDRMKNVALHPAVSTHVLSGCYKLGAMIHRCMDRLTVIEAADQLATEYRAALFRSTDKQSRLAKYVAIKQ
jgi:hypothetical protein